MSEPPEQGSGPVSEPPTEPAARPPVEPPSAGSPPRGMRYHHVNWLLLLPLIGVLVPEFYNFTDPSIGGMPFFYWYQLAWIAVSVVITWIVYRVTRGER